MIQIGTFDLGTDQMTPPYLDQVAGQWLEELEDLEVLEPTQETSLDHQPARRLRYLDQDGDEWKLTISGSGHQVVFVSEWSYGRASASELDRVLETFRFGGGEPPTEPPFEPQSARILPG